MFAKHGTRKISVASASSNLGNSGKLKITLIDSKVAVLVDGEVFWRLLSITFAMFMFNAMVKSMRLRKLQRPLMGTGEDRRRYSDKCQPLQKDEKDAHQKIRRLARLDKRKKISLGKRRLIQIKRLR